MVMSLTSHLQRDTRSFSSFQRRQRRMGPLYEGLQEYDIWYMLLRRKNLAETWLISVVVYVRTFAKIQPFAKLVTSITAGEFSPEAVNHFEFLRLYQILIPSKLPLTPVRT